MHIKLMAEGLFIAGCHRSGSTLLRYLLDAHPDFACPPESKFIAGLQAFWQYPQAARGLYALGEDARSIRALLRNIVEQVLGGYAARSGKPRWMDKTPNYVKLLPFLDELFEGEARYLMIVRHPLDSIISLAEMFALAGPSHDDPEIASVVMQHGNSLVGWARYWRDMNERIHAFAATHPARCMKLRYEDLVADPPRVLSNVLDFLSVRRYADDVHGICSSALNRDLPAGWGDPKIRQTRSIHRASIGRWAEWPEVQRKAYWVITRDVAELFGYDSTASNEVSPLIGETRFICN